MCAQPNVSNLSCSSHSASRALKLSPNIPSRCAERILSPSYHCLRTLALVDLLESIEHFLNRLDIYTKIPPTVALTEVVVKILVELLSALALVTKQIKEGKPSEPSSAKYYIT